MRSRRNLLSVSALVGAMVVGCMAPGENPNAVPQEQLPEATYRATADPDFKWNGHIEEIYYPNYDEVARDLVACGALSDEITGRNVLNAVRDQFQGHGNWPAENFAEAKLMAMVYCTVTADRPKPPVCAPVQVSATTGGAATSGAAVSFKVSVGFGASMMTASAWDGLYGQAGVSVSATATETHSSNGTTSTTTTTTSGGMGMGTEMNSSATDEGGHSSGTMRAGGVEMNWSASASSTDDGGTGTSSFSASGTGENGEESGSMSSTATASGTDNANGSGTGSATATATANESPTAPPTSQPSAANSSAGKYHCTIAVEVYYIDSATGAAKKSAMLGTAYFSSDTRPDDRTVELVARELVNRLQNKAWDQ